MEIFLFLLGFGILIFFLLAGFALLTAAENKCWPFKR